MLQVRIDSMRRVYVPPRCGGGGARYLLWPFTSHTKWVWRWQMNCLLSDVNMENFSALHISHTFYVNIFVQMRCATPPPPSRTRGDVWRQTTSLFAPAAFQQCDNVSDNFFSSKGLWITSRTLRPFQVQIRRERKNSLALDCLVKVC